MIGRPLRDRDRFGQRFDVANHPVQSEPQWLAAAKLGLLRGVVHDDEWFAFEDRWIGDTATDETNCDEKQRGHNPFQTTVLPWNGNGGDRRFVHELASARNWLTKGVESRLGMEAETPRWMKTNFRRGRSFSVLRRRR